MGLGWSLKQFLAIENMVLYCQNTIWELKGLRYDCCVWEIDPHEQEIKKKKKKEGKMAEKLWKRS